jgi:pimeloyl-ACP methyl ester carboxylesterase
MLKETKKFLGRAITCKTFVLVHGSWHGGWAWQAVIGELVGKGHRAYAPTLPGHGPKATRLGITHQDLGAALP